jgi:hypothetical protein
LILVSKLWRLWKILWDMELEFILHFDMMQMEFYFLLKILKILNPIVRTCTIVVVGLIVRSTDFIEEGNFPSMIGIPHLNLKDSLQGLPNPHFKNFPHELFYIPPFFSCRMK